MVSLYSLSCKKYTSYPRVKGGFNLNNSCAIQLVIINKNYIKNRIFLNIYEPMREVHPGNIHPVLDEFKETLRGPAHRTDSAHNTRETHPKILTN